MNTIFGSNQNNFLYGQMPPIQAQQGGFAGFVANFMKQFPGTNPQQMAMDLLNSGRMSQEDFKNFSAIANRLTGRR